MVIVKRFSDWDANTKRKLLRATFKDGYIRKYLKVAPDSWTFAIFNERQLIGWAMNFVFEGKNFFNIFVNKRFRKRGYAKTLIEAGAEHLGAIALGAWNRETKYLFAKMAKKYPGRVEILRWVLWREKLSRAVVEMYGKQHSFYSVMRLLP